MGPESFGDDQAREDNDEESDVDQRFNEARLRIEAREAARDPIEKQARSKDAVDDALEAIMLETTRHEVENIPEPGRGEVLRNKKTKEEISAEDGEEITGGWKPSHGVPANLAYDQSHLDDLSNHNPGFEWKIVRLDEKTHLAMKRKKHKSSSGDK